MEEFLKKLGIYETATRNGDNYIIDLPDSDEYARYYSKLDKSDLVDEDEESSQITIDNSSIQFVSKDDKYTLTLLADFEGDMYTLTVREN